jgi:hypothetical protein
VISDSVRIGQAAIGTVGEGIQHRFAGGVDRRHGGARQQTMAAREFELLVSGENLIFVAACMADGAALIRSKAKVFWFFFSKKNYLFHFCYEM